MEAGLMVHCALPGRPSCLCFFPESRPILINRCIRGHRQPISLVAFERLADAIAEIQQIDIGSDALDQIGIERGAECQPLAIGRPGERVYAEVLLLRSLFADHGGVQCLANTDRPEMQEVVVLVYDFKVAEVFFAIL